MRSAVIKLGCVPLAALLIGCSTAPPPGSRLDSSGLTVVTHDDPIMVARLARKLAAGARDYAYIGPVEINRMGQRDYYFWVGLASTVDRVAVGLAPTNATALALVVDEEPMIMPLSEWDTRLDVPPYQSTVPIYEMLMAQTSLDQIHRIAKATSIEIHIIADAESAVQYRTWQGTWSTWSAFPVEN